MALESGAEALLGDEGAVAVGDIEEVDAGIEGGMDGGGGDGFVEFAPLAAERPGVHADFGYLEAGLAESSIFLWCSCRVGAGRGFG